MGRIRLRTLLPSLPDPPATRHPLVRPWTLTLLDHARPPFIETAGNGMRLLSPAVRGRRQILASLPSLGSSLPVAHDRLIVLAFEALDPSGVGRRAHCSAPVNRAARARPAPTPVDRPRGGIEGRRRRSDRAGSRRSAAAPSRGTRAGRAPGRGSVRSTRARVARPSTWSANRTLGGASVRRIIATRVAMPSTAKTSRPPRTSVKNAMSAGTSRLGMYRKSSCVKGGAADTSIGPTIGCSLVISRQMFLMATVSSLSGLWLCHLSARTDA